jgi:hypothetical protein
VRHSERAWPSESRPPEHRPSLSAAVLLKESKQWLIVKGADLAVEAEAKVEEADRKGAEAVRAAVRRAAGAGAEVAVPVDLVGVRVAAAVGVRKAARAVVAAAVVALAGRAAVAVKAVAGRVVADRAAGVVREVAAVAVKAVAVKAVAGRVVAARAAGAVREVEADKAEVDKAEVDKAEVDGAVVVAVKAAVGIVSIS